jgi:hypothetical protein
MTKLCWKTNSVSGKHKITSWCQNVVHNKRYFLLQWHAILICPNKVPICTLLQTWYWTFGPNITVKCSQHSCFTHGSSQIQILAWRPAVLTFSMVFLNSFRQIMGQYLKLGHDFFCPLHNLSYSKHCYINHKWNFGFHKMGNSLNSITRTMIHGGRDL